MAGSGLTKGTRNVVPRGSGCSVSTETGLINHV